MSYEPHLIIKKRSLDVAIPEIEKQVYKKHIDKEEERVLWHILDEHRTLSPNSIIKFDDIEELIIFAPELSSFNRMVRETLDDFGVEYRAYF